MSAATDAPPPAPAAPAPTGGNDEALKQIDDLLWHLKLQDIAGFRQEGLGDADALLSLMGQDKKVKRGRLTFILMDKIGKAVIVNNVDPAPVRDFLAAKLAQKPDR